MAAASASSSSFLNPNFIWPVVPPTLPSIKYTAIPTLSSLAVFLCIAISLHVFAHLWRRMMSRGRRRRRRRRRRLLAAEEESEESEESEEEGGGVASSAFGPSARHHRSAMMDFAAQEAKIAQPSGLDKELVASLPTFTYTALLAAQESGESEEDDDGGGAGDGGDGDGDGESRKEKERSTEECSVCLSEFQENERCTLLPRCKHSFHTRCIGTWFLSNSTCPLCRTIVIDLSEPSKSNKAIALDSASILPHGASDVNQIIFHHDDDDDDNDSNFCESNLGQIDGIRGTEEGSRRSSALLLSSSSSPSSSSSSWIPNMRDRVQFPTNMLFWGSDFQVNSRSTSSLSHVIVDISRPQASSPASMQHPSSRLDSTKRFLLSTQDAS